MPDPALIALIADKFAKWQTPYGRPDPATCPFVFKDHLVTSVNMHSPTLMAIALYRAFTATGVDRYKEAADRYVAYYLAVLRNPPSTQDFYSKQWLEYMTDKYGRDPNLEKWSIHILTWPFIYGMALAAWRHFKQFNPEEMAFDSKAAAVFDWLLEWKWDEGSTFRNGYGSPAHNVVDAGNSDDNCHMGRGLVGYYQITGRQEVLDTAIQLARYYLTEVEVGTYKGCWSSKIGSWIIAPTVVDNFEHFSGRRSCEIAWGYSSVGVIDFLTELAAVTEDQDDLRAEIARRCVSSVEWQIRDCQFDDGSVGMSGRDDKWLGMTAGLILNYIRVRNAGFLDAKTEAGLRPAVLKARDWLLANLDDSFILSGGYRKVTGQSEPRPPENLAWLLSYTLEALSLMDTLDG